MAAHLSGRRYAIPYFTCCVIWLLLILTLCARRRLALPDGGSAFAPRFAGFFGRPFVGHAAKMGEFSAFARDLSLPVAFHGRESALTCFHQTSVVNTDGSALRMPLQRPRAPVCPISAKLCEAASMKRGGRVSKGGEILQIGGRALDTALRYKVHTCDQELDHVDW